MNSSVNDLWSLSFLGLYVSKALGWCRIWVLQLCFLFIVLVGNFPSLGISEESARDLSLESDFYSAIRAYDTQHLSKEHWHALVNEVASIKGAESYKIQVHDTMWDVSKTFFGDGFFWPHLWAANEGVPNPHLIQLGNTLYFFPGSLSAPPSLSLGGQPQAVTDGLGPVAQPSAIRRGELVIPPPLIPVVPLVRQLPPSLPHWQSGGANEKDYDETGVSIDKVVRSNAKRELFLSTIFTPDRPVSIGTIAEMDNKRSIGFPQHWVYLKLKSRFDVGDQLTIIRDLGQISEKEKGHVIEYVGTVTLTVDLENGKYMGIIDFMVRPVYVGDLVVETPPKMYSLEDATSFNTIQARVVGGESDLGRGFFSTQEIVFLDKGTDHGLDKGQVLSIFENRILREETTQFGNARRQIGHLQIVSVTPETATAVIMDNSDPIRVGDFTGGE